jgi:23S rRNA (pseudouridine1915-N3)-methyltransferase
MIKLKFIVVDKTRAPFLKEGEAVYLERVQKYAKVRWTEVKPVGIKKGVPDEEILTLEGKRILQSLKEGDYLACLDRSGHPYDSNGLADWLHQLSLSVRGWLCLAIGGPLGIDKRILEKSKKVLSLSRLTFTHEMSRLILLEQIYRALTILRGEKYHK